MFQVFLNQVIHFITFLREVWKVLIRRKSANEPPDLLLQNVPFLGHIRLILGDSSALWNNIKNASRECMERGGVLSGSLVFRAAYLITDPEDCLTVSNACLDKDYAYQFSKSYLGNSIFLADVETWKVHRKLLNPAFTQNLLNSFLDTFNSQARRLSDQLFVKVGTSCDVDQYSRLNLLESIFITSIGTEIDECHSVKMQYIPYLKQYMEIFIERFQKVWLHLNWIYKMSGLIKREKQVVTKLNRFSDIIIQRKKKNMHIANLEENKTTKGRFKPFIDLIFDIAKNTGCFNDDEIRMETNAIIFGGHDTSATTLIFALILIGSYPEVQRKVYEEIHQIFGNTDRDVEKDDLVKLVYIDAVLKETMRLYPVAPVALRYIDKDVQLKNYTLKPNSSCVLSIWGAHRHPMWGPDAEQFRPERWLESTIPNAKYFGAFMFGKRSCIGRLYAMMSMKTIIIHVVRKYRINADISKLKLQLDMLLKPASGHHINLELRE